MLSNNVIKGDSCNYPPTKDVYPLIRGGMAFIEDSGEFDWLVDVSANIYSKINKDAIKILSLCNGKNSLKEILNKISETQKKVGVNRENILGFIRTLKNRDIIKYQERPASFKRVFKEWYGVDNFKPAHTTIELTDSCNFKCSYCYRKSGPDQNLFMNHPIEMLHKIADDGIKVVELSGGEPLLHPQFEDILRYSLETFEKVAVLTNGVLLNDNILDIIEKYDTKTALQISLPTLKRDRFKKITGVDNLNIVKQNIKKAGKRGILTRVGTVLIDKASYLECDDIIEFVYKQGAKTYAIAPAVDIGRGTMSEIPYKIIKKFPDKLQNLNEKYNNFIPTVDMDGMGTPKGIANCGAGWKTYVIGPQKKVRPCPMFPGDFASHFIADPVMRIKFFKLKAPNEETCQNCPYEYYCKGCILRGWLQSKRIGRKCNWAQETGVWEIFDKIKEVY